MAPRSTNYIRLAEHETILTNGNGICYVLFSRQNEKYPEHRYEQVDPLPYASSDDDHTFVSPRPKPIPTILPESDQDKVWEFDEERKIWSRGSTFWGPPSFVLRVFNYKGEYQQQIYCGSTWQKFDRTVRKFNPNHEGSVEKYNAWLDIVLKKYHTGYSGEEKEEEDEMPWNLEERVALRAYVNDYIQREGLVTFVTNLNWEKETVKFNIYSREVGCNGPWRSEASILKWFGRDVAIFEAFKAAQVVELREHMGERISAEEMRPKDFISVREGFNENRIEVTAEARVAVESTVGLAIAGEDTMVEGDDDEYDF
jgi:hypothetical protein